MFYKSKLELNIFVGIWPGCSPYPSLYQSTVYFVVGIRGLQPTSWECWWSVNQSLQRWNSWLIDLIASLLYQVLWELTDFFFKASSGYSLFGMKEKKKEKKRKEKEIWLATTNRGCPVLSWIWEGTASWAAPWAHLNFFPITVMDLFYLFISWYNTYLLPLTHFFFLFKESLLYIHFLSSNFYDIRMFNLRRIMLKIK